MIKLLRFITFNLENQSKFSWNYWLKLFYNGLVVGSIFASMIAISITFLHKFIFILFGRGDKSHLISNLQNAINYGLFVSFLVAISYTLRDYFEWRKSLKPPKKNKDITLEDLKKMK